MTEALFDLHPPPIRKETSDYLAAVLTDAYDGLPAWALAPIDSTVRRIHDAPTDSTDFVWLIVDGRLVWALVDLNDQRIIALDPRRVDQSIWHNDDPPEPEPRWLYDPVGNRMVWHDEA